jgi:hypothetical protein
MLIGRDAIDASVVRILIFAEMSGYFPGITAAGVTWIDSTTTYGASAARDMAGEWTMSDTINKDITNAGLGKLRLRLQDAIKPEFLRGKISRADTARAPGRCPSDVSVNGVMAFSWLGYDE